MQTTLMSKRKDAWSRWCFTTAGAAFSILCLATMVLIFTRHYETGYLILEAIGFGLTSCFLWAGTILIPKNQMV
jgi:hypothetical protein